MRKFLLASSCIVFLSSVSNAQVINKGQKIIGGSIGFNTTKDEIQIDTDRKYSNIELAPSYAKAIKDNLLLGASINFTSYKSKSINIDPNYSIENKVSSSSYGGEIFLEKFYPLIKNFSIAAKAGLNSGYTNYEYKNLFGTQTTITNKKGFYTGIRLLPSLNYFFSKKLLAQFYFNDMVAIKYEKGKSAETKMGGMKSKNYDNFTFSSSLNGERSLSNFTLSFRYLLN